MLGIERRSSFKCSCANIGTADTGHADATYLLGGHRLRIRKTPWKIIRGVCSTENRYASWGEGEQLLHAI